MNLVDPSPQRSPSIRAARRNLARAAGLGLVVAVSMATGGAERSGALFAAQGEDARGARDALGAWTADPAAPNGPEVELVAQAGGDINAIRLVDDVAWVAVGPRLLSVDISDAAAPRVLGRSRVFPGVVVDVAIPTIEPNGSGGAPDMAWLAIDGIGLAGVRITDPADPEYVGGHSYSGPASGFPRQLVAIREQLWLLHRQGHLSGYDVSDPAKPGWAAELADPARGDWVDGIAAVSGYLVIASHGDDARAPLLHILDVDDLEHPAIVGTLYNPGPDGWRVTDMAVDDGMLWLLGVSPPALVAVDMSEPSNPAVLSFFADDDLRSGSWLTVADGRAYPTGGDGSHNHYRTAVVDVEEPAAPHLVGTGSLPLQTDPTGAMAASGTTLWIAFQDGHVMALDASDPSPGPPHPVNHLPTVGRLHMIGQPELIAIKDGIGVADLRESVVTLDLADPTDPRPIARSLVSYYPSSIDWSGKVAWIATSGHMDVCGYELHALDIGNPAAPVRIGPDDRIYALEVSIDDERAGMVKSVDPRNMMEFELGLLDISSAAVPRLLGTVSGSSGFQDVALVSDLLVGLTPARGGSFKLVVAEAPADDPPRIAGQLELGPPVLEAGRGGLVVSYPYAYAVTTGLASDRSQVAGSFLHVADLSDREHPVQLARQELNENCLPTSVHYTDGFLLLGNTCGLTFYDVRKPSQPTFVATVWTHLGGPVDAKDYGGYVYAAAGSAGLYVFRPHLEGWPEPQTTPGPATAPPVDPTRTVTASPTATATASASPMASRTWRPPLTTAPAASPTASQTVAPEPHGHVCEFILNRVPRVAIDWALANPEKVYGWDQLVVPGLPPSPSNTRKHSLSLRNVAMPYDSEFNPLLYKSGCP